MKFKFKSLAISSLLIPTFSQASPRDTVTEIVATGIIGGAYGVELGVEEAASLVRSTKKSLQIDILLLNSTMGIARDAAKFEASYTHPPHLTNEDEIKKFEKEAASAAV